MSYGDRLSTFRGYWDANFTTARQLAAIGHVSDRPPLESLEEGSRCITCSHFVSKIQSVKALEGAISDFGSYTDGTFSFHHVGCIRLSLRIPIDPQTLYPAMDGNRFRHTVQRFERRPLPLGERPRLGQKSSLFSLPTEIRLQIYAMVLPALTSDDHGGRSEVEIVQLNRDSSRVITKAGFDKIGKRDSSQTNLLRTCRSVHEEALDMLFTNITYKFFNTKVLYLFLRHIGQAGREVLEAVDILCGGREDAVAFALLASCPKLRSITIRLPRSIIMLPGAPLWCVDGMTCLLDISGLEEVNFGTCPSPQHMSNDSADAAIIRRELTRTKGSQSHVRFIDGYPDL